MKKFTIITNKYSSEQEITNLIKKRLNIIDDIAYDANISIIEEDKILTINNVFIEEKIIN